MFNLFDEDFQKKAEENSEENNYHNFNSSFNSIDFNKLFVISIGGSVLFPEKLDVSFIGKFAETIKELFNAGHRFAIVVGGGKLARNFIANAKSLGSNNFTADLAGIKATQLNALALIQAIENSFSEPLTNIVLSKTIIDSNKIPIYTGIMPSFTSDSVAALLSEYLECPFINLTNVDGIYSSDPRTDVNAKKFESLSFKRLIQLIAREGLHSPGKHIPIDLATSIILSRSKITSFVIDAHDLENFKDLIKGNSFSGTTIKEEIQEMQQETNSNNENNSKNHKEDDETLVF